MLDWETGQISSLRRNPLDEEPNNNQSGNKVARIRLEVTINHPRTKPFQRMDKERQRSLYSSLYFKARSKLTVKITEDSIRFEECTDGAQHLHAYLDLEVEKPYIPQGLVMDFTRSILQQLPKRSHAQLTNFHFSTKYTVFKCPAVCCQLTSLDDKTRLADWEQYINKTS